MKRILVTGGAGYIGSHTVVSLIEAGYEAVIVDDFSNSERSVVENLKKITGVDLRVYEVNCADFDTLNKVFEDEKGIDGVIHFAAYKAVGESVRNPFKYYDNNLNSTLNVLELMRRHQVKEFVFSSSCTVYGQPDSLPVSESSPIKPAASPYGHTKQICEDIIVRYEHSYPELKTTILRYFNPIGAHPSALIGELPIGKPENLIPFITQTAMGIREKLSVFGNDYNTPDGTAVRDYIHVMDLARAHVLSLNFLDKIKAHGAADIINLGIGQGFSVKQVIDCFEKVTGIKVNYEFVARRAGDVEQIYSSCERAKQLLGWECEYQLEDMISHAWAWQKKLNEI
jgi:UDP-glucose 4-epimerase